MSAAAPRQPLAAWLPIVVLGVGAGCISGLQPLLLDLLLKAGKLDVAAMGLAATAEAAGMAIAVTLAALCLPLQNLRKWALLALCAMALANTGTIFGSGGAIIALRFLNGLGAGVLLWVLVGMLARAPDPARLFAIYVTAQSVLGLCLSQAISGLVAPDFGHVGAYGLLLGLNALMLLAVPAMVDGFDAAAQGSRGLPGLRAVIVLLAMTAFLAGIMGLWVYLLPLLGAGGFAPDTAASAVSVGLAAQIAGGLLAALVGAHIGARTAWIAGIALAIGAIALMNGGGSAFLMLAGAALFGFVWIFVPPFHMPAVLAVDPSGRGAMLVGTAQLSGTVIGPLVAAPVVTAQGVSAVWTLSAAWLALSLALLAAAQFHKTPEERIPS
ncbi:hypothetical protein [Novosphingobium sp. ERN07]|uniref:hypothetical protein n=1 Tax=Novosphingobium sp. ERN07 TaxID=2726187 RepID=UPI00351BD24B